MSNLNTFHTLNERVKKYKNDNAIESMGLAFDWVALEIILNLSVDEIEDAITDGAMDGGIDAMQISDRDVHIFNFKYTDLFEHTRKSFPESEIDKLLVTVDGILTRTIKQKSVNQILWDKILEIWDLFNEGPLNFKFYFCSNKRKLNKHVRLRLEQYLGKYKYVDFSYFDQDDLVSRLLEKRQTKVNGELSFIDLNYFDRSDGPLKAIVATVAATDLVMMVRDPDDHKKINESAFDENCRVYLKLKNTINRNIYETAVADDNYKFYYLNNGITIVCDTCEYAPHTRSPRVSLTNLQVVNGGQTTHALFEAFQNDEEKLRNVLVLVRICEAKDRTITERISETTNSQTPVSSRDLRANDGIQKRLEEQFRDLGYFYERKKNLYIEEARHKRLDNELLAQLYLAFYFDMPSEAKNQKSIVFGSKYDVIFDENEITALRMLVPYEVYLPLEKMKRVIQTKKRRKESISEKDAFISRATFHLVNSVKYVAENEELSLGDPDELRAAVDKAIKYTEEVIKKESKGRGELYTHDKFFKEIPTNKIIREHILSKYS